MKKLLFYFFIILCLFNTTYAKPPIFSNNYKESVKISKDLDLKLIVIFSADWCKYCDLLRRDIGKNLDKFENTVISIIDYDENPELVQKYRVNKIPRSFLFEKGKLVRDITGYSNIENFIKK